MRFLQPFIRWEEIPKASIRLIPIRWVLVGMVWAVWGISGTAYAAQAKKPPVSPPHYAPFRQVDFLSLRLEIIPYFHERRIEGKATLRFRALQPDVDTVVLNAEDLNITNLVVSKGSIQWTQHGDDLILQLDPPLARNETRSVTIAYSARPKRGLYFRTPELGYPKEDTHLFTQGESITSRCWFPCYDAPDDRLTSELLCWVPKGMIALSNGRLVEKKEDPQRHRVLFHWLQDKPHVTYLVTLVAGYFDCLKTNYHGVPILFYSPPSFSQYAHNSFAGTVDMIQFYEEITGTPYPWDKYAQVCVRDFVAGGMENTTLTVLTARTLYPDEMAGTRSSRSLVSHELAHQWFGDYVTCEDWSQLWLNEGFATYFENLYMKHYKGEDTFRYLMWQDAQSVIRHQEDTIPPIWRRYDDPEKQFSFRNYPKAAWVLHMLRCQIGEDQWRKVLRTYLKRFALRTVETADFKRVVEEVTGMEWDRFFDQWLRQGGVPRLRVAYRWNGREQVVQIHVRQIQKIPTNGMSYVFPLKVRFGGTNYIQTRTFFVQNTNETFSVSLPSPPKWIRIDPDLELLAEIQIDLPRAMWERILRLENDVIGRILAIQYFEKHLDEDAIRLLGEVLTTDPFYGVRIEAARTLGTSSNPKAGKILLASLPRQTDERVRQAIWRALSTFHLPEVRQAALQAVASEKNPDLQVAALRALAMWNDKSCREAVLRCLHSVSFRDTLARGALAVIQEWNDPTLAQPLLDWIRKRTPFQEMNTEVQAIRVLASTGAQLADRTPICQFLLDHLDDSRPKIRQAVVQVLGTLGDSHALPMLRRLAEKGKEDPLTKLAQDAIKAIQQKINQRPAVFQELQKQIRSLQQRLQKLERRRARSTSRSQSLPATSGKQTSS